MDAVSNKRHTLTPALQLLHLSCLRPPWQLGALALDARIAVGAAQAVDAD